MPGTAHSSGWKLALLTFLTFACALLAHTPLRAQGPRGLKGDSAAIAMARRLVQRMGGDSLWSRANWLYARERAWYASRDSAVDVEFWRRTDAPAEWGRLRSHEVNREHAWTATSGWERRDGRVLEYDRAQMQSVLGWWPGEIYVMYVRFARNDPNLRLVSAGPRAFIALDDADGENLGEFHFAVSGELVRWVRRHGTNHVEYVYGPLKKIGPVWVPDWGTQTSGGFRFYYTDFRLSESAPPISFGRPPS